MKKRGNISIVLLISLVVLLGGSAITSIAVNSKYNEKQSYQRIENRYIAESGVDLSLGLFENYLVTQKLVLTYTKNQDGSYSVLDEFSPYLIDEIRQAENLDKVEISLIATESNDYLVSIGFLDFKRNSGVELSINTFNEKSNFKLSQMCIEPNFLIGNVLNNSAKSKINPIYLTVKVHYKGGEVLCNVEISDLYVVRQPFKEVKTVGELASVEAIIDTASAKIKYNTYQNYKVGGVN